MGGRGPGSDDDGWIPVLASAALPEAEAVKATLEGMDLFLYRADGRLYALANRCTHAGGPLDRGLIGRVGAEPTVTCPFHGSLFRLVDGNVLRGPATLGQPAFDVRDHEGSVEIRDRG